jgi:hypothetical protein
MTKGYAFAYQVLRYWFFEKNVNKNDRVKDVEVEYRSELIKYSYNKLWSELSEKDKEIVITLVELGADNRGDIWIPLPQFGNFIKLYHM